MTSPSDATAFAQLLRVLCDAEVEFILVGGFAGNIHGTARVTYDVDVVYARSRTNLEKLVTCLAPLQPYLRGAPPGLPFQFDLRTLCQGLNFTLVTSLGHLDLLGEVAGGGTYESLAAHTQEMQLGTTKFRCVNLEKLIELKRAAGRPKDLEAIAELEALRQERGE